MTNPKIKRLYDVEDPNTWSIIPEEGIAQPQRSLTPSYETLAVSASQPYSPREDLGGLYSESSKYDEGISRDQLLSPEGIQDWRGQQQSRVDKIANGAFVRFPLTTITKFAEMAGYTATSLGWAATGDISTMTDNPFSTFFRESEEKLKEVFPIYYPKSVREGNLWDHITSTSFWMEEGTDAAAFFAAAMGTGYLTGGIAPGLQAAGIPTSIAKGIGLGAATTLQTIGEAGTEAAHLGIEMRKEKEGLLQQYASELEMSGMSPEEIDVAVQQRDEELEQSIARAQAGTFSANVGILIGPNILMNRMLFGKMFDSSPNVTRRFIDDVAVTGKLKPNPMVTRREAFNRIAQNVGKGIVSEGFWEEGMQESSSQYFKALAFGEEDRNIVEGILGTYWENLDDVDFQKAIFLGGVLGGIGGVKGAISKNKAIDKQVSEINDIVMRNPNMVLETLVDRTKFDPENPESFSKAVVEAFGTVEKISSITKQNTFADISRLANKEELAGLAENSALLSWAYPLLNVEGGIDILNKQLDKITEDAYNEYTKNPEATKDKISFEQHKAELKRKVNELQEIVDRVNNNYGEFLYDLKNTRGLPTREFNKFRESFGRQITYAQINTRNNKNYLQDRLNAINARVLELQSNPTQDKDIKDEIARLEKIQGELPKIIEGFEKDFEALTNKSVIQKYFEETVDTQTELIKEGEKILNNPQSAPESTREEAPEILEANLEKERAKAIDEANIQFQELSILLKSKEITKEEHDRRRDEINEALQSRLNELEGTPIEDGLDSNISPETPTDVVLDEDYGDNPSISESEKNTNPRQPFIGIDSFKRTTNAQHKIIKAIKDDSSKFTTYEPIIRFQQFIDGWNSKSTETLVGYTWGNFKTKFKDLLPADLISTLESSGNFRNDYTVVMVLSDKDGNAIESTSHFGDNKVIQFGFMSDLTKDDGTIPYNKRTSGEELVDMEEVKDNPEQKYKDAAKEFEDTIRQAVVNTPEGLKFSIEGKTTGLLQIQDTARNLTAEEVKNTKVLVPIDEVLSVGNETRIVRPGFVYLQIGDKVVPADRVRLESKDRDKIIAALQYLMLNPSMDNYSKVFEAINTYTYMIHRSKGMSPEYADKIKSKFYIDKEGKDSNFTAVVFGDNKTITKEQLLANETQELEEFLSNKFYNVDTKRLKGSPYTLIEEVSSTVEDGVVTKVDINFPEVRPIDSKKYTREFLLDPKSPKLKTRLVEDIADKGTKKAYTNPQVVNRSLRFEPVSLIVKEPTTTEEDKKATEASNKFVGGFRAADPSKAPKAPKTASPPAGVVSKKPKAVENNKKEFTQQAKEEASETWDDVAKELTTLEQQAAIDEVIRQSQLPIPPSPSTEEINKEKEKESDNLLKRSEESDDVGTVDFMTKNSDSPVIGYKHGLFEEYTAWKQIFKNTKLSVTGLQALRERDGGLRTINEVVEVLINPFAAPGTLWHEGFHIKNLLFNTPEQRKALYDELRKELKGREISFEVFEIVEGEEVTVTKKFKGEELSDKLAEEYLAEQFRAYMLVGKDNYKFGINEEVKRNFFERIWDGIVEFIQWATGRKVNKDEAAKNPDWLMNEFESITKGVFDVNKLTNLPLVSVDKIGNVPQGTSNIMVKGINSLFFKIAFERLDGATVLQDLNTFFPSIYKSIKLSIEKKIQKGEGSPVMELILKNWKEAIYEHRKFLRQYSIDMNIFDEALQDNDRGRDNANWFDANTVDVRTNMQTAIKLLLASINQYNSDGSVVYEGGLPQSAQYQRVLNRIQHDLSNAKDFNHMVEIMQKQSDRFPLYKELMKKLGISPGNPHPVNATPFQISLQTMFFEQFNKSNVEMLSMILGEEGNNYITESVSTSMNNRIITTWKNNVKYRDPRTTGVFKLDKGRFKLDFDGDVVIGDKVHKLSDIDAKTLSTLNKTSDAYREFLSAFGIILDPQAEALNDMKNAANGIIKAVSESLKKSTPLFIEDIFNRNITTINKELNALADVQAEFELDVISAQYTNEKGQTEHSIGLKNTIDKLLDDLNYTANTGENLPTELRPFDPETGRGNLSAYGSRWTENVLAGNAISRGVLRAFGKERGEKVDFDNLKPADHLALQLEAVLNGYTPYIRSADRKREYSFGLGRARVSKVSTEAFREELRHYLKAELVAAIGHVNSSEAKRFQRGKDDIGLNFFKDITPFLNSAPKGYKGLVSTRWEAAAEEILNKNSSKVTSALNNYIADVRERTKDRLIKNRLFSEVAGKDQYITNAVPAETLNRLKFPLISRGENLPAISSESLDTLVDTYNYQYITNAIESTKLITGSLSTYVKGKGSELHKRTTLFTSPASPMRSEQGFIDQLNENEYYKRLNGKEHSTKYKQITIDDVNVESQYKKLYEFFIGNKASPYGKVTENDAAGGIFMDAFRDYHVRGKGWSEVQDKTWQYQAQILFKELVRLNKITPEQYKETFSAHLPKDFSMGRFYYKGEEIIVYTKNKDGSYTYNLTQFSQKKPVAVGLIANEDLIQFGKKGATKTALTLYLPSDFVGNDAAILWMWDNMQNGIDFIYPKSAEKAERLGNLNGELPSLYKEDGSRRTASEMLNEGFIPTERFWKDLGDQLDIDPSGHERATDSTQKRRLIFLNAFDKGNAVPGKEEIVDKYNEYVSLYNALTTKAIEKLVDDLGLTGDNYELQDIGKFVKVLTDEFSRRELPDNAFDAVHMIFNTTQRLKLFDALPSKRQFVNLLQGLVRARAIQIKVSGDMLIQQASTGMEASDRSVESSNFLKFYRPLDSQGNEITPNEGESLEQFMERVDTIAPAQAMVGLPINWIPFVDTFSGTTFEKRLENFNEAITNPENKELYDEFKKIRTYIANRIPGQDLNSIEALEIVKFLSPFGGPRVVLPTEIVIKSGSDFDVDKLTTYFNNVRIEKGKVSYIEYDSSKAAEENSIEAIENRLNEINKDILLNKNNFAQLITPNSPGVVEQAATALNPESLEVKNNELLEPAYNNVITYNQLSNKAGVGIAANNSSAHALQQRHPIRVRTKALQLLFDGFTGNEELFLGNVYDSDGNLISENNASVLTAFVDAASKVSPDTGRINLTTSTANTYSLLNRLGGLSKEEAPVGFMRIARLMTSKVVSAYEEALRVNDAEFIKNAKLNVSKTELVNKILTSDSSSDLYVKQLAEIKMDDRVYLFELMEGYIKTALNPKATAQDKIDAENAVVEKIEEVKKITNPHWKNLEMFLYYQEASKLLNMLQQVTRPDAGLPKNRAEVFMNKRHLQRLLDSNIFESSDIQAMLSDSYIKGFAETHNKSLDMFNQFHLDYASEEFRSFIWEEVADFMDNPLINRSREKSANALMKVSNAALNYILHTTKTGDKAINSLYTKLVTGKDSLPRRLGRLKNEVYNNPEKYPILSNNPVILEFVPVIEEFNVARDYRHEIDYIKTFNRRYTTEESNALTQGLRELLESSDSEIASIGRDIIDFAIIQSGVQVTPFSFFELLPADAYFNRVMGIIENYFDSPIALKNNEAAKDYIFSNLINDTAVVPRLQGTGKVNGDILRVKDVSQNTEYEYLSKYVKNPTTRKYELRLFKRVSTESINGNIIYKSIDMHGDPNRFFEAYEMRQPSIIKSNTRGADTQPAIDVPTQPKSLKTFPTRDKAQMTYSYGNKKRGDVKSTTTFEAIKAGERTATTRYESDGKIEWWSKFKEGDVIDFEGPTGETISVQITKALYPLKGSRMTPNEWSKLEGWNVEYFIKNVKPRLDEAWQIQYEYMPTSTAQQTSKTFTREEGLETIDRLQISAADTKPNPKLNEALNKFLDTLGVRVNSVREIVDSNGKIWGNANSGAVAISRIINRTIDIIEGRADRLTLPEEASHFYVELLDRNSPLYKVMMKDVVNYELYQETLNEYSEAYEGDVDKIKREAVAKIIAHKLAGEKLNVPTQDKQSNNWLRALWNQVKSWFNLDSDPFKRAAANILKAETDLLKNVPEVSETSEGYIPSNEMLRRTPSRLEMLDDVAAAQKAEMKRNISKQRQAELTAKLPRSNEEVTKKNNEELSKVSSGTQLRLDFDTPMYQLTNNDISASAEKELDNYLLNFMKEFGVQSQEINNLKEVTGLDSLGVTDVLNKMIWYDSNRNIETIPEEVGHVAIMLMGKNHADLTQLLDNIESWNEFKNIQDQYLPIYGNMNQVRVEAAAKLIAKALVKNYKAVGINKDLLNKVLNSLRNILTKIKSKLLGNTSSFYAEKIAVNMLLENKDYIFKVNKIYPKLDYAKAVKNNPLVRDILYSFGTKMNNKLVGSLAIAGQGELIYRDGNEPIHDLDFIVTDGSTNNINNLVNELNKRNAIPVHNGWNHFEKGYTTYAFLIPADGLIIDDFVYEKGWLKGYTLKDIKGNPVDVNSQTVMSVDFFVYDNIPNETFIGNFSSWNDIYNGKLGLTKQINPVLFSREKDQIDYVLSNPKNRSLESDSAFVYYQIKESKVSEQELAVQDIFRNFDKYFPDYSHWTDGEKLSFAESMDMFEILC